MRFASANTHAVSAGKVLPLATALAAAAVIDTAFRHPEWGQAVLKIAHGMPEWDSEIDEIRRLLTRQMVLNLGAEADYENKALG